MNDKDVFKGCPKRRPGLGRPRKILGRRKKASARSIEKKPREASAGLANVTTIPIDIVNDAQKLLDDLGKSFEEMRYQAPPQSQPPARHLTFLQRTLGGSSAPKSSSLHQEQQQYERDTRSMPASNFWHLAKSSYPILHEIARKVHAIQASEADVERSFSIIKNSYTPNLQSLDLKMLEKLMILKEKDRYDTGET
ncbi:Protein CBG04671 [Caenorhabditis briggsae]|uniref:Protein CBG04671 n=1 Tax=Caenorhabditis briggsae TaxID=6238 RepID=A8WY71_CAEBR|nr:Protein CBG04671 [Caenorhabditis briggsae]CAP25329.1 Protein CBG04671 [Caenorhabditis briggsae]